MSLYLDIRESDASRLLETETTGITRTMEHAGAYLSNAHAIWSMLDPGKADQLKRLLTDELQIPAGDTAIRLKKDQVEELVSLLSGIEDAAVGKVMDSDYHVLPHMVDDVNRRAPGLATRTSDASGATVWTLDKLTEIEWLRAFLEVALRLNCNVVRTI